MYFDPVTGAPAAMPQIQFPTSQTAATPVEGGFTVGDYAKKKRIAEALRAKTGQGYSQMDPVGFVEGSGGQPGQAYINYGNIISNAMQPWLEGRREEKAAAAEDEAAAARQQALDQLLGKESISKADALRAQEELGVDASILMPEEMNMAARAQASASRSGLNAMLQMKVISPEEHQAAIAQLEADERAANEAELEQIRAREAAQGSNSGRAMTELELFMSNPELYKQFKGQTGGGLSGGAETATVKEIIDVGNKYKTLKTSRALESEMDKLIEGLPKTDKGGVGTKAATIATLSEMVPFVEQVQSPEADRLVAYINSQILAVAEGQKGVLSDTDMKIIKDSVANIKKNPESVRAVWEDTKSRLNAQQRAFETQLENYRTAYGGQFAPTVGAYYEQPKDNPLEGVVPVVPNTLAAPQKTAVKRKSLEELQAEAEAED